MFWDTEAFKRVVISAIACLMAGLPLAAQPSINPGGVVNAASYAAPGLPNAPIAQGSIFAIFGKNLGPTTLAQAGFPLPTVLAGTSVRVSVGGQNVDCYLIYTSAGQVAALLPSRTPVGTGTITVTYNNQTSAPAALTVAAAGFGIFTVNQAGAGPGVITDAGYGYNLINRPARPEQVMILWGTGLGPVDFDETRGAPVRDLKSADLEVWVGGRRARVDFAGRAPGFAGLDQINFAVPAGIESCYVPVAVRIRGVVSNFASMAVVARGNVCSDPLSFAESDFQFIGPDKETRIGDITLTRMDLGLPPGLPFSSYKSDDATGVFHKYDYRKIIASSRGVSGLAPFGQCTVFTFTGQEIDFTADPVQPAGLDAGPALNLSGPKGTKQIPRKSPGYYTAALGGGMPGMPGAQPDYLDPGTYTVDNGNGGADVGPFRATLRISNPVVWDRASVADTIARNQDLRISWSGGAATDFVQILGISSRTSPDVGAAFLCTERAQAGSFTVPSLVLSALPASQPMSGMLMVGSSPLLEPNKFNARGLDIGYFTYSMLTSKSVTYQ